MFAAMTAPGPWLPLQVEGWLSSLSLANGAVIALPPLCVGKWWIDRYETDQPMDLKETVRLISTPHVWR